LVIIINIRILKRLINIIYYYYKLIIILYSRFFSNFINIIKYYIKTILRKYIGIIFLIIT